VIRAAMAALAALAAAAPLAAQNGRENFVQPDSALDAVHATQRDAFLALRDSTSAISAAGARLMSDMGPNASLAWMQARSRGIANACAGSEGPLAGARTVTSQGDWPLEAQKQVQSDLLKAMKSFGKQLADCRKTWTALAADTSQTSLRESAPYEMKKVTDQVTQFNLVAGKYLRYIDVKLPPPGTPIR
jgi:hypothetical protein